MEDVHVTVGNLPAFDFYLYSLYLYTISALLFSVLFARDPASPSPNEIVTGDRVIKKVPAKPKGSKLPFPQGKVAYCTYCDRYIQEESMVSTHESGKQHKEKAAGAKKWHEFRPAEEAKNAPKPLNPNPLDEVPGGAGDKKEWKQYRSHRVVPKQKKR
jgi:hypothetical protein